jgi:putative NADPH-quinone reductase
VSSIAIVVGHARKGTYCEALGQAYLAGARAGGHQACLLVTSHMRFDPILHNGFSSPQPLEPDLAEAQAAIRDADHLVIIFPLWYGTLPAILKGFIERVFEPGFAVTGSIKDGTFRPLLKGKSARIIMTMGMPGLIYRWYYGAHTLQLLKRNILGFVGFAPVRATTFGMVEAVPQEQRRRWLAEVEALGRRAG